MVKLDLPILWEDSDLLVVNKPPGVVVNRAESVEGVTVADWACERFSLGVSKFEEDDKDGRTFRQRCGVGHRLDKETSGCLLIAKNPKALASVLAQFRDRETKKEYLALVHGHLTPEEGTIRLPLSRSRFDREKWEIKYSGKMAETAWRVEEYYQMSASGSEPVIAKGSEPAAGKFTLVRLFPKTGRTHQIRVHLAHLGFPIFADEKYLTKSKVAADREKLPFHFLHAQKIGFKDRRGSWQAVEAPLPPEAGKLLLWMESE